MQLRNILLSEEAENKKKSDKQKENSSLYKRLDNYVGGRVKWKRIAWEIFSFSCIRNHLIDETVTHICDNVYTPTSLAYITDMHHGLNLTGIDNMRKIEFAKKHASKLVWSSSQVNRVQRQAEIHMQEVISFTVVKETHQETYVDGVRFDIRALFEYLITSFGLSEDSCHRNIEIYVTVDGAKLDENSGHVTIVFKICNKNAKDPVTGKYIHTHLEGLKDDDHVDNLQSGAWCFPILSILAKYNKGTYEKYLRPIFEYCEELRTLGVTTLGWKPFIFSEPQDMKSCWLCLHRGGAAKSPKLNLIIYFNCACTKLIQTHKGRSRPGATIPSSCERGVMRTVYPTPSRQCKYCSMVCSAGMIRFSASSKYSLANSAQHFCPL
jgi:hypothetical protein